MPTTAFQEKKLCSSLLEHLLCSKCVRWSHRYRRSPRLSTAPGDQGTGRAAVRLSLHNKPGFSEEEHRRRQAVLWCFRISRSLLGVGVSQLNVFLHVGKLFCGVPTPGCSSPLCPTEVAPPAVCPYLWLPQETKGCSAALATVTDL